MTQTKVQSGQIFLIGDKADEVAEKVRGTAEVIAGAGEPALPGWELVTAIHEAEQGWAKKANRCGESWNEFAGQLDSGAATLMNVDADNGDSLKNS